MRVSSTALLILFCFILCCCSTRAADKSPGTNGARQEQEDDIREAVFRYQFATNEVSKAEVYFLSVGLGKAGHIIFDASHDPSDAFVKRFADSKPIVKKASASDFGSPSGWVADKRSGKRGVLFCARTIKWVSETEVEVNGGFVAGMMYARDFTYTLVKEKGKWRIKRSELTGLS